MFHKVSIISAILLFTALACFFSHWFFVPLSLFALGFLFITWHELYLPRSKELQNLHKRIDDLEAHVTRLSAAQIGRR
jgi:cell division protein FtsB